jgi:hypothetical protein
MVADSVSNTNSIDDPARNWHCALKGLNYGHYNVMIVTIHFRAGTLCLQGMRGVL